ncbi:MAG: PolC-type DNA polymerase III [Eubacteriales bacterium]|jgi:DNA polymerase-3 subunit alpha (Gram-positive type)
MEPQALPALLEIFHLYQPDETTKEMLSHAQLTEAIAHTERRSIQLTLTFSDIIPSRILLYQVQDELTRLYQLSHFEIHTRYSNPDLLGEAYFQQLIPYAKREIPGANGFLDDAVFQWEEGILHISLQRGGESLLKLAKCDTKLAALIREEFGCQAQVCFDGQKELCISSEEYRQHAQMQQQLTQRLLRETPSSAQSGTAAVGKSGAAKGAAPAATDSPILLGREIRDAVTPMRDITQESGRVTVEGRVFALETREVSNGSAVVLGLDVTDEQSSLHLSRYFKKPDWEKVADRFKKGMYIAARGEIEYNKYDRDINMRLMDVNLRKAPVVEDTAEVKRVELHLHTNMSAMDGMNDVSDLVKQAIAWGHKAMAITDHGVVQSFPTAMKAAKGSDLKVIYGVEAYFIDDTVPCVYGHQDRNLRDEFIMFDLETTGLNPNLCAITEIGAVRVKNGEVVEEFDTFVDPEMPIPPEITKLTGISDEMVQGAPKVRQAIEMFYDFCGDAPLVAHNSPFDAGFMKVHSRRVGLDFPYTCLDTVALAKFLLPNQKKYKLDILAKELKLPPFNHHRACDDSRVLAGIFHAFVDMLDKEHNIHTLQEINIALSKGFDYKKPRTYHQIILVKNLVGLKNLYKLVSYAHLNYYYRRPRTPKSVLMQHREGLLIGSACDAGELYTAIREGRPEDEVENIAKFYDYLEIQPLGNVMYLVRENKVASVEELQAINRHICQLGEKLGKPVVATGDVHFLKPEDQAFRAILMAGQGFADADNQAPLYFRTTQDMLQEFAYLGEEKAYEVVVTNPGLIADMCEKISPISPDKCPPSLPNDKEDLERLSREKAYAIYGDPLPDIVKERMEKELHSIIGNGYAVMYMIAQKLVQKSLSDGYLVGSRGSVGSSFVAFLSGITEVNSLCPHYVCPQCKHSEFVTDGSYYTGVDMPDKDCPHCGTRMKKDGFDIPFETFLGFYGDKEPDIDLNFSGEYQARAHKYTGVLFGEGNVFKAGTIGTLAEKTAYGYVKKYLDERGRVVTKAEENRLTLGCTGIKRTTGQHPGGIVVCPRDREIYDFTPVQHPADDVGSDQITTHFDYHSIDGNLLKLDILGHDDPTVIRMLEDLIKVDHPEFDAKQIPLDDKETMRIFTSVEPLGLDPEENDPILGKVGSFAIPEFGTKFVRGMLVDTQPTSFIELVNISGLSHGTDVWLGNAADLVHQRGFKLDQCICCRDDIMIYLIRMGLEPGVAFKIMESVRKGKGLSDEWIQTMKEHDVPQWYIDSCLKIKYMFPKAHAVAYVTMAYRIAYCKVHYPEAFYCAYFTVRADEFEADCMINGIDVVRAKIDEINHNPEASNKEKNMITVLEVCYEMYKRGFTFCPIDLYRSHPTKFQITPDGILPPLNAIAGLGDNAANSIAAAREEEPFATQEDLRLRAKVSKTILEVMDQMGILEGIPKTSQLSLF